MQIAEAYSLIGCDDRELEPILDAAGALRDRYKGRTISYSRKIFLPITNLCRDRCGYCTGLLAIRQTRPASLSLDPPMGGVFCAS